MLDTPKEGRAKMAGKAFKFPTALNLNYVDWVSDKEKLKGEVQKFKMKTVHLKYVESLPLVRKREFIHNFNSV